MANNNPANQISKGLSEIEVTESRNAHGRNVLTPPRRPSAFKLYLGKFNDPIIRILLLAACLSLVVSIIQNEYAETIGIFCAVFLATGISFYFENDAARRFDELNAIGSETTVKVVRGGNVTEISRSDVVVGDNSARAMKCLPTACSWRPCRCRLTSRALRASRPCRSR